MAKTHRHDAGFASVARRRKRAHRNRVRGDVNSRSIRTRDAIAEANAQYAYETEILDTLARGEL